MKFFFIILTFLIVVLQFPLLFAQKSYESENLKITPLSENVFVHVTYLNTESFGKVACNGMLFKSGDEVIIFDTPSTDAISKELSDWIESELACKVKAVIPTHFHVDCLGGLRYFHEQGIPSYANHKTITLASLNRSAIPQKGIKKRFEIVMNGQKALLIFPGQGHTKDNIIAYIPSEKALFGGCLIKSLKASKGYLGDANVKAWSKTVAKIKKKYSDLKTVVPGHGNWGGTDLLDYTINLFERK